MPADKYPTGTVRALLETDLVTPPTRAALHARLARAEVSAPRFFAAPAFAILRAACARLIPQPERAHPIDLAGALDERLAEGRCDGWRYSVMPPDGEAHRRGLRGLDESAWLMFGREFIALTGPQQDAVLLLVQHETAAGETWRTLPAKRFFEELLAELTEIYYSHPLAKEEIGDVSMADAHGWQKISLAEHEAHEPRALETNE